MTDSKTTPKTSAPEATPAATVAAATPKPPPTLDAAFAYDTPKQLRAKAGKAEKAGDKKTADKMRAAATLREQQQAQEKATKAKAGEMQTKAIALLQTVLGAAYAGGDAAGITKAITALNVLPIQPAVAPFTVRVSDEPPHVILTTRGKKEGAGDARPTVNAKDLATAGVDAFLDAEGKPVEPAVVNNKPVAAHPVAYLNAHKVCYYDRECRNPAHADELEATGKLTDAQKQSRKEGKGLRHGDSASRAYAAAAVTDTVNKVRMHGGGIETVKTVTERIIAAQATA